MFVHPQDNIKYLKLIGQGELAAALDFLKEKIDDSEMYMEVIHLSCRYHIIVNNSIVNFPASEKMIQLNLLSLAMLNFTKLQGRGHSRVIN